jgi:pyruvate, orthophosphate dikinase
VPKHTAAAAEVQKSDIEVKPEAMIPLVGFKKELDLAAEVVHRVAKGNQTRPGIEALG